jgi:23S rRNA (uracil1939-C5)-methyltransferase
LQSGLQYTVFPHYLTFQAPFPGGTSPRTISLSEATVNSDTLTLTVESLAYGGDGVAHIDGRVIFIPEVFPGDIVRVRVAQDKGTYLRGALEEILAPSADRTQLLCPMAERCGGCQWLALAYPAQLAWKRAIVEESLRRLGHIEDVVVEPCVPSLEDRGYRTVARFPARHTPHGLEMGYFARRTHHIVDVGDCPLSSARVNRISAYIRAMPELKGLDLREVTIRAGYHHPSALVSFLLGRNGRFEDIGRRLLAEIEGLEGVCFWREDTPGQARRLHVQGSPFRYETVRDKTFRIEERSFFQINIPQAESMVNIVGEMIGLQPGQRLVDGYGGVGLFALSVAPADTPVHLFDLAEWAVEDAVYNAREMGFQRFKGFPGDAKAAFERAGTADRLIVDPPRTGLGLTAVEEM